LFPQSIRDALLQDSPSLPLPAPTILWFIFTSISLFLYFINFDIQFFFFFFLQTKGNLDLNEQIILGSFYNSLTSSGTLNWNTSNDLCGQTGVICDSSNPQRVIELYFSFFFFCLSLLLLKYVKQIPTLLLYFENKNT